MNPRSRSILGALLALLLIPFVVGILACLPVPIGNPEHSKIDPYFSGLWVQEAGPGLAISNFEPYDERTWLLAQVGIERVDECPGDPADPAPVDYASLLAVVEKDSRDCYAGANAQLYKAWLSELGGQRFMTWELKGLPPMKEEQEHELYWFVSRVEMVDTDLLRLWLIDENFEGFEGKEETRKAYEEVVETNVGNTEMYVDDPWIFRRAEDIHGDFLEECFSDVISHD